MQRVRLVKKAATELDWKSVLDNYARLPVEAKDLFYKVACADQMFRKANNALARNELASPDVLMLCRLMSEVLGSIGMNFTPWSIGKLVNENHAAKWGAVLSILEFKDPTKSTTRNARDVLYRKALTLLVKDIQRMKLPLGPRLILSHLHRIPQIYDKAYPGYIKGGATGFSVGLH